MGRIPLLWTVYVSGLRQVLRCRDLTFVLGAAVHGVGQAGVVLLAAAAASLLSSRAGDLDALWLTSLGLVALMLRAGGGVAAAHGQARLSADVGAALRLRLFDGWLRGNSLHAPRQGDHAGAKGTFALTDGARTLEAGFGAMLVVLRAGLQLVPLGCVLVALEPRLAAGAAACLLVFAFIVRRLRRALGRSHAAAIATTEELTLAADETVRHADLWRVHGAERTAREHMASIGRALARHAARTAAGAAAASGVNEVLAGLVLVGLVLVARSGVALVHPDRIIPFVATFFLAYRPLRDVTEAQLALGRARATCERLANVLADAAAPAPAPAAKFGAASLDVDVVLPRGSAGRVKFRAQPGRILAVRGPTGAGKTTLLRVLLGLERAERGTIRYGEKSIDAAPGLARPFAWVPQDAPVLADTLAENIRFGGDADPAVVLAAIGAERLVAELGDARLGPLAVSGGERQWIAIARALATDRPVLLLDEPTSGLDQAAQHEVLQAIRLLRGKRTVILVTHRPEPLAIADEVIELERAPSSAAA